MTVSQKQNYFKTPERERGSLNSTLDNVYSTQYGADTNVQSAKKARSLSNVKNTK